MWEITSSITIEDKNTDDMVSVVESTDDPTINCIIVCNADWSNVWV